MQANFILLTNSLMLSSVLLENLNYNIWKSSALENWKPQLITSCVVGYR